MQKPLCLFDVDGTLTPSRKTVSEEMLETLRQLKKHCVIGFVGGSDLVKQQEQLGDAGMKLFDFWFAENGLSAFRDGRPLASQSFIGWIGEDRYKALANFILKYVAELDIPQKRGTFLEFRNGMINVSPIGRNCSQQERDAFEQFDKQFKIREKFVEALKLKFPDYNLTYSIGGQISFDVFPTGWDKTYCLKWVEKEFKEIYFFGDKTEKGGNDFEIFTDARVKGNSVKNPAETIALLKKLFLAPQP